MSKLTYDDFVGNMGAVSKVQLLVHQASEDSAARIPDMAFLGPSGHGKNTLAQIISDELGRKLLTINSTVIKDPFQFRGLIIDVATHCQKGSIIMIDECHALARRIQDNLLTATEYPRELHTSHKDQVFTDKLPENLSFIFATTHGGNIQPALLTRLEVVEFLPYSTEQQLEMAIKYMKRQYKLDASVIEPKAMVEVARRARNGRQVARFCDMIVRYMKKHSLDKLTVDVVNECFNILGVDANGLTRIDKMMLRQLAKMNTCVGLDTLDAVLPTTKKEIKECIEPFLLKKGYIVRTSAGRMITTAGMAAVVNGDDNE